MLGSYKKKLFRTRRISHLDSIQGSELLQFAGDEDYDIYDIVTKVS